MGGKLLVAIKSFYEEASTCVKISGQTREYFEIKMGLRQGCVMSPWLFNIYRDGVMREMKGRVGEVGVRMYAEGRKWVLNSILFADDTVLIAENESDLQNLVSVFNCVCKRRKLKVNVNKSKVMVCERSRSEAVDFVCPYRVGTECEKRMQNNFECEEIEEVNEFKYLGSVMCKYSGTEGETSERALQGRKVVRSLGHIMNGRSVSMEVKRDLRNTVIIPILTYANETWAWSESQRSRVQAVEMSYLRSACGVSRIDGMSNESVYEHFGMCHVGEGKKCGVVEEVKRQTLK